MSGNAPFDLDETLERNPAAQKIAQAPGAVVGQAKQQADLTSKAILDQLYAPSTPGAQNGQSPEVSPDNPAQTQQQNTNQQQKPQQAPADAGVGALQDDQAKLIDARKKLQKLHMETYGNQFTLEGQMQRDEAIKKQQEEQLKSQPAQEEQKKQEDEFKQFEKQKTQEDLAVVRAKTKAERFPGASG